MANAGNMQASSEQATRNGIQALESALTGIQRSRSDVDGTRANLSQGYQGSDGGAFGQLLQQWDEQANIIQKNLQDMIEKLNTSLAEHGKTQNASQEAIGQATRSSDAAFSALAG